MAEFSLMNNDDAYLNINVEYTEMAPKAYKLTAE
jgi:hypothetical protein